ncbi:MAG: sigma-70 family RNA polymerase sigma factor [Rubricoccaceae bacterium]
MSTPNTLVLLREARDGEAGAADRLFAHVYDALRQLARARLRLFRPGDTLNTTALVHEVYLRLVEPNRLAPEDRAHFFALAARAMRFVLVDAARERTTQKRGGGAPVLQLDAVQAAAEARADDLLALDEALAALRSHNARLAELVDLRFFGGYTYEEIADITGRSAITARRDWVRARAWLHQALYPEEIARS